MKYKLLVLDLDGTLTNSQKEISPANLDALERAQKAGIKIVLASGRPTYGITPIAKQLKMDHFGGYILAFNGGKIIDFKNMEVIFEQILPMNLVPSLHAKATEAGAVILSYKNEFLITENPEDKYVKHELFLTKMTPQRVDNFSEAVDFNPDKCLIVGEPEAITPLGDQLNAEFGDVLSAYRSEPFFLEVVPKGVDKALSLKRLLEHTGHTTDEMCAAGDGFNDLSMIELAGFGVAMANGQDVVKAAADYITLSNDEDGIADLINKHLLQ